MTVHWIDPVTRARIHAVLACLRIKGVRSYDVLAQTMINIHYEFRIEKKVIRTRTDNGRNFVMAFVQFSREADIFPDMPSTSHDVNSHTDNAVAALLAEPDIEQELEFISLENVLATSDASNTNEDDMKNRDLPVHMRYAAAHTFNLIASKDADAALKTYFFKTPYRSGMAKARAIWNLKSLSTVASDNIVSELGRKLVIPNTTRWNSTYDALVVLNTILETKRPALHRIMSPVAMALDLIQSEAHAYLRTLLPTIATTVFKLQDLSHLMHLCTPLANVLLSGIKKN